MRDQIDGRESRIKAQNVGCDYSIAFAFVVGRCTSIGCSRSIDLVGNRQVQRLGADDIGIDVSLYASGSAVLISHLGFSGHRDAIQCRDVNRLGTAKFSVTIHDGGRQRTSCSRDSFTEVRNVSRASAQVENCTEAVNRTSCSDFLGVASHGRSRQRDLVGIRIARKDGSAGQGHTHGVITFTGIHQSAFSGRGELDSVVAGTRDNRRALQHVQIINIAVGEAAIVPILAVGQAGNGHFVVVVSGYDRSRIDVVKAAVGNLILVGSGHVQRSCKHLIVASAGRDRRNALEVGVGFTLVVGAIGIVFTVVDGNRVIASIGGDVTSQIAVDLNTVITRTRRDAHVFISTVSPNARDIAIGARLDAKAQRAGHRASRDGQGRPLFTARVSDQLIDVTIQAVDGDSACASDGQLAQLRGVNAVVVNAQNVIRTCSNHHRGIRNDADFFSAKGGEAVDLERLIGGDVNHLAGITRGRILVIVRLNVEGVDVRRTGHLNIDGFKAVTPVFYRISTLNQDKGIQAGVREANVQSVGRCGQFIFAPVEQNITSAGGICH